MQNIKTFAWIVVAGIVIFGFLWIGNRRTDALMEVGNCVERKVQEDGFSGTIDKAWETYADSCVNEQ